MAPYFGDEQLSVILICFGFAFTALLSIWFYNTKKNKKSLTIFLILLFICIFTFGYGVHINSHFVPYEVELRNRIYS